MWAVYSKGASPAVRAEMVQTLLRAGAVTQLRNSEGHRAINGAAMSGYEEVVDMLAEAAGAFDASRPREKLACPCCIEQEVREG